MLPPRSRSEVRKNWQLAFAIGLLVAGGSGVRIYGVQSSWADWQRETPGALAVENEHNRTKVLQDTVFFGSLGGVALVVAGVALTKLLFS